MGRSIDPQSDHWKSLRARVIKRDGDCFICHTKEHLTAHHIKPRRIGGKTNDRNLITLCEVCHNKVEYYDLDWAGIINLKQQRRYGFSDDFTSQSDSVKIGKDRFGVFVIRGAKQSEPVIYEGAWPRTPTVKDRIPVYDRPAA
jgi:hypothetical protein